MPDTAIKNFVRSSYRNPERQYWFMQLIFWLGVCLITFLSLTLWYGHYGWTHVQHTLLQGAMGLLLSIPLRKLFLGAWHKPLLYRSLASLAAIATISAIWTGARMITFIWISREEGLWADFGGWYFGGFFIFLCWASFYHGTQYFQLLMKEHELMLNAKADASEEQLKRLTAESVARDAQLMMLRYQLNPHFLFNTLNAINALVQMGESAKAQRMIVQLSQFLRYSLDNNPDIKIPLENEIEALMLYLEIEKTRFGDRLTLDFQIQPESKTALVPSLLLQPLIENSLKYAIGESETGGTISLVSRVEAGRLILDLSDTGSSKGIKTSKLKSQNGRGIGLKNTIDRLQALYPDNYGYDLDSRSANGLKTSIEIPYESLNSQNQPRDTEDRESR